MINTYKQRNQNIFKIDNQFTKKPKKLFFTFLVLIIFVLVCVSFITIENEWVSFFSRLDAGFQKLKQMFTWDLKEYVTKDAVGVSFLAVVFDSIWLTLTLSVAGTFAGVVLAIPFALVASSNIVHNKFSNSFSKFFLALFRTIPSFVIALLLMGYFGQSTLTLSLALMIVAFAVAGKIFYERIEQVNIKLFNSVQATGANKFRSFKAAVLPQVADHFLYTIFYIWEINIKYMAVISVVSYAGIGTIIDQSIQNNLLDRAGFAICTLILLVLALEILLYGIRKFILEDKDFIFSQNKIKKIEKKYKKKLNTSNLKLYLNEVVLSSITCKINKLNDNLQNSVSNDEKESLKKELQKCCAEKENIKKAFIEQHKAKIADDVNNYNKKRKTSFVDANLFIHSKINSTKIRIDKVYLTEFNFKVIQLREDLLIDKLNQIALIEEQQKNILDVDYALKHKPHNNLKRIIFLILFTAFIAYCFTLVSYEMAPSQSIQNTNEKMLAILNINWKSLFIPTGNLQYSVIYLMFESLAIAVTGTFIGAIFAYFIGLLASEKVANKYVAKFFILLINIMRSIPAYIFALILVAMVSLGTFAGMISLSIGTTWMLAKYNRETFNDINMKIINQLKGMGMNNFQLFIYGILPQTLPPITAYIVMAFDSNFKNVAMLGTVGAGNLGYNLTNYYNAKYYNEFGALLLGLIIFTLIIEYIAVALRAKILYDKNLWIYDRLNNIYKQKRFSLYKANEKIFLKEVKFSYAESEAYYYFVKNFKKEELELDDYKNKRQLVKETKHSFKLERQKYVKANKNNANNEILNLKINFIVAKDELLKSIDNLKANDLNNNLDEKDLMKSMRFNLKSLKKEFNRNKTFIKSTLRFKKLSLDY